LKQTDEVQYDIKESATAAWPTASPDSAGQPSLLARSRFVSVRLRGGWGQAGTHLIENGILYQHHDLTDIAFYVPMALGSLAAGCWLLAPTTDACFNFLGTPRPPQGRQRDSTGTQLRCSVLSNQQSAINNQ